MIPFRGNQLLSITKYSLTFWRRKDKFYVVPPRYGIKGLRGAQRYRQRAVYAEGIKVPVLERIIEVLSK
jgi:hypothetical protein